MSQPTTPAAGQSAAMIEHEWTFQREGQVFGPFAEERLRAMVESGEIAGDVLVSRDSGPYRPLAELSGFVLDLKKAEARLRVEREVTDSRRLAARRRLFRGTAGVLGALAVVGGAIGGAAWLAVSRPWQQRSALLDDFGAGIVISVPARIGSRPARRPGAPLEVAVPAEAVAVPRAERPPRERAALAAAPPSGSASLGEGGLVAADWNQQEIQGVIAREQRSLAPCVRQEAGRSPDFAGEIPIEFAIGNEGRVEALWIDEPRFKSGPLHECLFQALRTWRFRPFQGQRPVVSLAFRIGGK